LVKAKYVLKFCGAAILNTIDEHPETKGPRGPCIAQ